MKKTRALMSSDAKTVAPIPIPTEPPVDRPFFLELDELGTALVDVEVVAGEVPPFVVD
jgi:hypothetical protein